MAQRVTTYMKNVAKSFGYALGDTFAEYNPVIKSIGSQTKETASDMYDNIKSFVFEKKSIDEKSFKSQAKDTIDDVWKNFKDDLKTGNWYNKERQSKMDDAAAKAMGLDFDFDFDDDWGDFDDFSEESSTKAVVQSGEKNAVQIINAVDDVGFKIASSVSNATAESAGYIVASNNKASRALYSLNERGFTSVNKGLASINDTIGSFAQITTPLTAHMQNSALFYTSTTKTLTEMNQSIQQLVKNTTPAPLANSNKSKSVSGTFSSMFDSDGVLDLNSYKEMVKENFKDSKDMIDMAMNALKSMKGENGSYGKNISMMQYATTMMTKVMLPKVFKESMKSFNESLKYAISGGVLKLRDKSGGLVTDLLKEFFLPKDGFKNTINTGNYNKDAVAWDGIARKALTEVIPEYLAGIYRVLSGEDKVYNYNTGKFVTRKSVEKDRLEERRRYAKNAGGDFRTDALDKINKSNLNDAQKAQLNKEIENYFYKAFEKGSGFTDINKSGFKKDEFGLSEDSLKILQELIGDYRTGDRSKRNRHTKFTSEVQRQRDAYGDYMRREEANGTNMQVYLQNGFASKGGKLGTDEYDHDMNFYLRGIYQYTGFLADNISFIGGKSKKVNKRKKVTKGGDIADINTATSSQAGERTRDDIPSQFKDEDEVRAEARDDLLKKAKEEGSSKIKGIRDKIKGFFSKDNPKGLIALYNKPFDAMALFLDKMGLSMDKLIWGDDDKPEKGIFGYIFSKTKDMFDKFSNWLDDKFGLKDKWNKVKDWAKNGGFGDFVDETKQNLGKAGKSLGNTVKQFFGKRKVIRRPGDISTAAHGRKVTKSGIVAVSEGELIIPSELNPFYHGATNKSHQINNERRLVNNFYGMFANGGIPIPPDDESNSFRERARQTKERLLQKYKIQEEGKGHQFIKSGFETLGKGFTSLFNGLFGDGKKETAEKDNKIIKTVMQKLLGEMGDSKGAMGAGALIGAGVSVATGAVVGPLFGAAIGATAGLIANSKTVQKILFGADEDGNVNGGLFNKNISEFMMKNVPSMAKGGALGGIAGLFMGSPILGAVVGAATGYVTSSEKARTYLFGKDDGKGGWEEGLIPKSLQDKIKKAAPNMAAGALAGLAIGPFGIAGNLLVGAGVGYLTTSEKFHTYMFGDGKDDKGLVGIFREKIFNNLDNIFHNMGNAISGWGKNLIRSTSERLKDFFTKRARAFENGEQQGLIGKLVGGSISLTGRAVKGATNFVGNRLGNINSILEASNLRKGYAVYNREEGRNMFASERRDARGGSTRGTFGALDNMLANAGSIDELKAMRDQLEDAKDPSRMFKRSRNTAMNKLFEELKDLDPKKATKIANLVQKGDPKALNKIISILTPEEQNRYMSAINEALQAMSEAKNSKVDSKAIIRKYKEMGIDISKSGNLNSALDRINDEMKNTKFSPEEQAKKEEKDWRERVLNIFRSMDINIAAFSGGKAADGDSTAEAEKIKQSVEKNGEKTSIRDILNGVEDARAETKTEFIDGQPVQMIKDNQGHWTPNYQDSDTKEALQKKSKFMETITNHVPLIGGAIGGLTGLFGSLSKKLFGDGEEKKGLFGSLLGLLGGENGPLKYITNLLSGSPIGTALSNIKANATIGTVFQGLIAPALLAGGFTGAFDGVGTTISSKIAALRGNDTKGTIADNTNTTINGKQLATDENGNFITNEKGEYQTIDGEYVSGTMSVKGSNTSVSAQLKKNLVTGTIMGTGSVASQVVKSAGKSWNKMLGKTAESAASNPGLVSGIMGQLTKLLEKIPQVISKIPFLPATVKENADTIVTAIYTHLDDALKSAGSKLASIAGKLSNVLVALKIAYVVAKGIDAWGNAESILGITEEATTGQKIIAVLIAVLNALIPVLGDLIPNKVLVNIFMEIAPKLGIDVSSLAEQRAAAQKEVEEYNKENGTDLSIEEYNQMNGKAGIFTKAGNAIKSTFTNIKEQGLGKTLKGVGSSIKEGAGKAVSFVKEGFTKTVSSVNKAFGVTDIFNLMKQGDIKGVLSYSTADEDDGTGMSIIKNIPTLVTKYNAIVPTLFVWLGKKVSNTFKSIIDKVKGISNIAQQEKQYGDQLLKDPDSHLSDFFKIEDEDPENPMGGFAKAFRVISRLTSIPIAAVKKIGNNIKEGFNNAVSSVKNSFTTLFNNFGIIRQTAKAGDVQGLWNLKMQEDPENPVGGITNGLFHIMRLYNLPNAGLHWVGNKIKDGFNTVVNKAKNSFTTLISNYGIIRDYAKAGDVQGLWNLKMQEDPENPVGGLTNGVFHIMRLYNLPNAGLHWVGNKIKDGFMDLVDKTKSNYSSMNSAVDLIKTFAKKGDIDSIWAHDYDPQDGDPLKFIWSAGYKISQLFQSAVAIFYKIMGPVKELVDGAKEVVGNIAGGVGEKVGNFVGGVKEKAGKVGNWVSDKADGLFQSFKGWLNSGGNSGVNKGFVSQFDSKYKNIKLGNSTVAEKGCGPAVATMISNQFGAGLTMDQAIKFASRYQDNNGTKVAYFKDVLGSRGINTEYLSGDNIPQQVLNSLAQGKQVILLGQDKNNNSKSKSPFGPNSHYVIASGLDSNGNIIIKDPESNVAKIYNSSILKNATFGINTNKSGGAPNYNSETAQKAWSYFTSQGYSPAATAGILANLQAESGMNPERFQDGGPAAGIAQWENYKNRSSRWAELNKFAQSKGYAWSELDPQLQFIHHELQGLNSYFGKDKNIEGYNVPATTYDQFKVSTDPGHAAMQFEKAFERAGKPHMANRLNYATEFYKLFHDSSFTGNYVPSDPTGVAVDNGSNITSADSTGSTGLSSIIGAIGTAFTNAFGKIFGTNSSSDSVGLDSQENQLSSSPVVSASSIVSSGNPAVGDSANGFPYFNQGEAPWASQSYGNGTIKSSGCGPTSMAMVMKSYGLDANPSAAANWSLQNGYRVNGVGTSWDFFNAIGKQHGLTTTQFTDIQTAKDSLTSGIPVIASMKPGDFTKGGHFVVLSGINGDQSEVYVNDPGSRDRTGKVWDANKALGQAKNFWAISKDGRGSINMQVRLWNQRKAQNALSAAGSGLVSRDYAELARLSGGSSGILLSARPGSRLNGNGLISIPKFNSSKFSGGDSALVAQTTSMLNSLKTNVTNSGKSGAISADLVEKLLNSIIKILETISNNTSSVERIYQVLSAYTQTAAATNAVTAAATTSAANNQNSSGNSDVDANIKNLVGTLAAIAKG